MFTILDISVLEVNGAIPIEFIRASVDVSDHFCTEFVTHGSQLMPLYATGL